MSSEVASEVAADQGAPALSRRIGAIDVVALSDGRYPTNLSALLDVEAAEVHRLGCGCEDGSADLPVNVFLLTLAAGLALVDTGAGPLVGPTLGETPRRLQAAGVESSAIRYVLMTHLHPDHAGGLIDDNGAAVYRNAEILIGAEEAAFWLDGDISPELSERTARNMGKARSALAPYRDRIRRVAPGEGLEGVSAVFLPGHTPGHLGWMVEADGERLLLWGDVVHFGRLQAAHPEATVIFDVDRETARATRLQLFELAARDGLEVAGAHLAYPGFHRLRRAGEGFALEPSPGAKPWSCVA